MRFGKSGLVLLVFVFLFTGCLKEEYSYEGGTVPPVDTTTTNVDTTLPVASVVHCSLCKPNDPVRSMQWHFMYEGISALCGPVTKAVLSPEKNAMTFFGPSACTIDTGLIMTAFFDTLLDQDRENVRASRAVIQYYIKNSADDVFRSREFDLTLFIDKFVKETKLATGHFSGAAFTPSNLRILVESGTFNITFE